MQSPEGEVRSTLTLRPTRAAFLVLTLLTAGCAVEPTVTVIPSVRVTPPPVADTTASPGASLSSVPTDTATPDPTSSASTADPGAAASADAPTPGGPVVLAADAIGDVSVGTREPLAALERLLGKPDHQYGSDYWAKCGSSTLSSASWGDFSVSMDRSALLGWSVSGHNLPANLQLPYGIKVGDPLSASIKAVGVQPEYWDWLGYWVVADGVWWWSATGTPGDPIARISTDTIYCG